MAASGAAGVSGNGAASGSQGVTSVMESVDGVGNEPKFGREELGIDGTGASLEKPGKVTARKNKTAPATPAGDVANLTGPGGLETEATAPAWNEEAAKFFESELNGEPASDPNAEDPNAEVAEGDEAARKHQQLMQVAEQRAVQAEQAAQQMQSHFAQMQNQFQQQTLKMQTMMARLQTQNQMLMNGFSKQPEQLDDVTRAKRELMSEAEKQIHDRQVAPLKREVEQLKQSIQQDKAKAQTERKVAEYRAAAGKGAREVALKGLPQAVAEQFGPEIEAEVLATMWEKRTDAANAAKLVRNRHLRVGLAFVKAQAQANKEQLDQTNREVPKRAPNSTAASARGGDGLPPWDVIVNNGYKSVTAWELDGKPPLKWPGK